MSFSDLDPSLTGGAGLVYNQAGAFRLDATVPPGALTGGTGWVLARRTKAWIYREQGGAGALGKGKVVFSTRDPASRVVAVDIRVTKATLLLDPNDEPLQLAANLGEADEGLGATCASVAFEGDECQPARGLRDG